MHRPEAPRRRSAAKVLAVAGLVALAGCTHNHYYYGEGGPAMLVPGETVVYDDLCALPGPGRILSRAEAPVAVASDDSGAGEPATRSASTASQPSRIVISRPSGSLAGGGGWSPRRDGRVVTTEAQGQADDPVRR